jgi:hypothetical protein
MIYGCPTVNIWIFEYKQAKKLSSNFILQVFRLAVGELTLRTSKDIKFQFLSGEIAVEGTGILVKFYLRETDTMLILINSGQNPV